MNKLIVNTEVTKGHISKDIQGQFSEHLGRCIYGGLYVGENSDIPNVNGMRSDVVKALKEVGLPVLRWPGGCFADEYHWQDGIGPKETRKKMVNTHWGGVTEDNSFGTHEFFELCKQIGCDTYVCTEDGSEGIKGFVTMPLEELLGVAVDGIHAGPESHIVLTLVGDGLPYTAGDSVLLVEFLADCLLTRDDGCGELLLVHLGDPLGLEVDRGESGGYAPVEDIGGDVVDVLPPELLRFFLSSGPGCVVDLRDDLSRTDLESESLGHGVDGGSHDHVIRTFVCHSSVFDRSHVQAPPTMLSHSSLIFFQS